MSTLQLRTTELSEFGTLNVVSRLLLDFRVHVDVSLSVETVRSVPTILNNVTSLTFFFNTQALILLWVWVFLGIRGEITLKPDPLLPSKSTQ